MSITAEMDSKHYKKKLVLVDGTIFESDVNCETILLQSHLRYRVIVNDRTTIMVPLTSVLYAKIEKRENA